MVAPSDSQLLAGLCSSPRKRAAYAADPYFRESAAQAVELLDVFDERLRGHALVLLKPDLFVLARGGSALDRLRDAGYAVRAARQIRFGRHEVRELWRYRLSAATLELIAVLDLYLGSAPCVALLLEGSASAGQRSVSEAFRDFKGAARPDARRPHELRALLETPNGLLTGVHAADDAADLVRELGVLLAPGERAAFFRAMVAARDEEPCARGLVAQLESAAPRCPLDLAGSLAAIARHPAWQEREITPRALLGPEAEVLPLWDRLTALTHLTPDVAPGLTPTL